MWNQAEPGATHFVTRYRNPTQNLRTQLLKIIKRAGLDPWPKLWQNLRATRQTELEEQFPSHVVCQWIGNSRQVAAKHYLQTTPEHYAEAVSGARTIFVASRAPQGVANEKSTPAKLQKQAVTRNASHWQWALLDSNTPQKHGKNAIPLLHAPFL